ncbi:hypothetical protein Y032_0141g2205 [Ancylostoma ceylanicum]|uniref:Endonuclease/exonuclease/phosphatase domain-containing protein n=1 Tax=Ancylostoma ceylanicum TaxID=53326 RepID=A0A016T403_9BILA|nr:hypothetical protein Y032_0141g2205 [Ancylostoma ceylanicum]
MISKLFGFLSELFSRSRTHQQWERVLGKQLEVSNTVERISSVQLKRSGKVFPYHTTRLKRTSLPMLVPQNSILLWKDPIDAQSAERPQCLSLLFDFCHNGSSLLVTLRRPLSEPFLETAKKIEAKIQKLISPQKGKKSAILNSEQSDEVLTVTVEAPGSIEIESLTLENVVESQRDLLIGGQPYSIIREPVDISTLTCALKPLAGCPIYPAIDFRQGSEKIRPIMHWYTYRTPEVERVDGKSKENTLRESITMLDGEPFTQIWCYKLRISMDRRQLRAVIRRRWEETVPCRRSRPTCHSQVSQVVRMFGLTCLARSGVSKYPVETIDEPLIFEDNIKWCQEEKSSDCLRIVSYNILADLYLDLSGPQESLFFPYCPKAYQMYEYRHPLVMKELLSYDMDLCFLQEVDHRMQMRYLSALFHSIGVEMCFSKKEREVTEGSVIAFRRERFDFVFSECYGLASLLEGSGNDVNNILSSSSASSEIFSTRPTTIQVLVLRDRISGDFIVCGNTHLHHNPKHEHLKALQAAVAVRKLESIRKRYSEANPDCAVRLVLAGDFNSTPDGPVYELLSTGVLPKSSPWWNLDENIVPEDLMLLPSGEKLRNLTGTEITNYTRYFDENGVQRGFCGCLDYIWTDSAELHRIAPRPSHELLTKYGAIPSKVAPSDHIPLLCEVRFNKIQKNT